MSYAQDQRDKVRKAPGPADGIPNLDSESDNYLYDDMPVISFTSVTSVAKDISAEVSFSGLSQSYCVCFVDMVNSTKITSTITEPEKLRKYYMIFLNSIGTIVKNFEAKIIKNAGDALIYYFPLTADRNKEHAFKDMLECNMTVIDAYLAINSIMKKENLPPVDYRISADYGKLELARSVATGSDDLFGAAMNVCAKINSKALPNGMVIGENLYNLLRSFNGYLFSEVGTYVLDSGQQPYRIYSVKCIADRLDLNPFKRRAMPHDASFTK